MKKILIVDDSRNVRYALRKEISHHEFIIKEASSGEEALEIIPHFMPDLITLDIEMEDLDGFETCTRIRRLPPPMNMVPVLFLTGHDSIEKRFKGFESGATEFYSKQFPEGELLKGILSILLPAESAKNTSVLVVDDTESVTILVRHCLKGIADTVFSAANGEEGLQIFLREKKHLNCVITDYEMPGTDGRELCRNIRCHPEGATLPVIFLSGHSKSSEILDIYQAGGSDYIQKPFIREEFIARVQVHIQASRNIAYLQNQVVDLRQMILTRNFQFIEEKKEFSSELEDLLKCCRDIFASGQKSQTPLSLKALYKRGVKLLERLKME